MEVAVCLMLTSTQPFGCQKRNLKAPLYWPGRKDWRGGMTCSSRPGRRVREERAASSQQSPSSPWHTSNLNTALITKDTRNNPTCRPLPRGRRGRSRCPPACATPPSRPTPPGRPGRSGRSTPPRPPGRSGADRCSSGRSTVSPPCHPPAPYSCK